MFGLSLLFGYLKSKFFNLTTMFLGAMLLLISLFVLFNSDTVLSRFGFETKTNLKAQVVSTKKDLNAVLMANAESEETARDQRQIQGVILDTVVKVAEEKARVAEVVGESKTSVRKTTQPVVDKVKKENPPTSTSTTISKEDANQVSVIVIESLHSVYDDLFPPQPAT